MAENRRSDGVEVEVDWRDLATRMAALLFRSSTICCSTGPERDRLRAEWEAARVRP